MGFSTGQGGHGTQTTLSEINVTPLVDVMLVLLIVFMVSAPLMQQGVQVDLPKANAGTLTETPEQIVLVVTKDKKILINEKVIKEGTLRTWLETLSASKPNLDVFISADQGVPYGFVAQVMAEVKKAKIQRVGLVTDPGDPNFKL
ncbi:MAG: biopolymer transporter ExbD [Bdellovibrionales bacterium]|nr:biopolymer transporter ExbD [Bdellovibrionales bacterium]